MQRLARELHAALADAEVKAKLVQLGLEPVGSAPSEFASFVQAEMTKAADIVKARGIKVD